MTSSEIVTTAPLLQRRCAACSEILVRREGEQTGNWKKRTYCDSVCFSHSRRREDEAKTCVNCGEPLKRRPGEDGWSFARRISCGKDCGNQSRGMTFEKQCKHCGKSLTLTGTNRKRLFCSRVCQFADLSEAFTKPKVRLVCQHCKQDYYVKPYIPKNRVGKYTPKFCSKKCRDADQAARPRPQFTPSREIVTCENPNCGKEWVDLIILHKKFCSNACEAKSRFLHTTENAKKNCTICGNELERHLGEQASNFRKRSTCSHECRMILFSQSKRFGSKVINPYPMAFSRELREIVRERDDYACQECGVIQTNRKHDVHHIDFDKHNCNPSNLITLCRYCHAKTVRSGKRAYWISRYHTFLCERFSTS